MWATQLFDFYHAQELAANPKVFLTGVIEIFMNYPAPIVAKAVSPVRGIPRIFKFPPRISEIVGWLEKEMEPIKRELERKQLAEERARSITYEPVRTGRLSYDELKAKYGENWGLNPKAK